MLTAALTLAAFALGFWLCDRLKDRRAERAEAKLCAYELAARIDPAHHRPKCSCRHD